MATSVWSGHVTFGLVSFPVKLFSAARGVSVSFNMLHKHDNSRIKQVIYCQAEDKPIPRSEIVKGYEYEKDQYVVIEDEDIKKAAPPTAKVMEILEFVKAADVDPIYMESSYYMLPDENGRKPYTLLFTALKDTGYVGLAKVAMHNREHIVILRPDRNGIVTHTMYFADEVRRVDGFSVDTDIVKPKELELAKTLIASLEAEFEPEKYHDAYRQNLMSMIEAKVAGRQIVSPAEPRLAPVIDIMEALKRSLAEKEAPPATATAAASSSAPAPRKQVARASKAGTAEEAAEAAPAAKKPRRRAAGG